MCNSSSDEPLVTARWVLSNLIATYKHHLSTVCKIKKQGTILYRTGCDLLTTLSKAYNKSKSNSKVQSESVPCASQSMDGTVEKINIALREQIKTYIDKIKALPFRFDQLDINALISELDPSIWSFIQ